MDHRTARTTTLGWMMAAAGGALAYLAAGHFDLPRPLYLPISNEWRLHAAAESLPMGWYGLLLWGAAGFLAGFVIGSALDHRRIPAYGRPAGTSHERSGARVRRGMGIFTVSVALASLAWHALHEAMRWLGV